jgi:GntR family transcriptional regulator
VQTIEPTVVSQAEAELLGVPHLSPALLFECFTSDTRGGPVEYVHSVYRATATASSPASPWGPRPSAGVPRRRDTFPVSRPGPSPSRTPSP